jgi:tRNA pseudouridine55 synthase
MKKTIPLDTNLSDGYVINVDKPLGWTSTDVVRKIKYGLQKSGYRKIKVGHAGTLDPLATGVLLVCLGKATKRVDELQAQEKEYVTEIMLGASTPSHDMEHEVDRTYPYEHITREMVERALAGLTGERLQTPPLYSAKKVEGQRAYEYAREGTEVELRQALVNIYEMELLEYDLPRVKLRIRCSKGTYIRSIARELGEALGSGGYLTSLRRTCSGQFSADAGMSMDEVADSLAALREKAGE